MADFAFVQLNPRDWINFLAVDVDHPDALERLLHPAVPAPHWVVINPVNGHGQAGWMIDPVFRGEGAAPRPMAFAAAVQEALDNLVGGDRAFTRFLVRNPVATSPAGEVRFGSRTAPYPLGELKAHMVDFVDPFEEGPLGLGGSAWDPRPRHESRWVVQRPELSGGAVESRNCAVFYGTRRYLWSRLLTDGEAPRVEVAEAHAQQLNEQLVDPLGAREVREIAASAVRQVERGKGRHRVGGSGEPNKFLALLGRRGGAVASSAKVATARENIKAAIQARASQAQQLATRARRLRGSGNTVRRIAELLGRCERTIRRYLTQEDTSQPTGTVLTPGESLRRIRSRGAVWLSLLKPLFSAQAVTPVQPLRDGQHQLHEKVQV